MNSRFNNWSVARCTILCSPYLLVPGLLAQSVTTAVSNVPVSGLAPWQGTLKYQGVDWQGIFAQSRSSPQLRALLFKMVSAADGLLQQSSARYVRATKFSDIPAPLVDSSAANAGTNQEQFALAMYDCTQTDWLRSDGVLLAVAGSYTKNPAYTKKAIEILEAVSNYSPFQRPGWTLSNPNLSMPAGGDGVWLATSWGINGVVEMLDILGDDVPVALRAKLKQRLREEVDLIVESWSTSRPWYVKSKAFASNQWSEPAAAVIKASLFLGDESLRSSYNFGVDALAATLRSSGSDGAFLEGFTYAQMSVGTLLETVADMKRNGDTRCSDMPFAKESWRWFVAMPIAGRYLVNCSDSKMSELPEWAVRSPISSLVEAALIADSSVALATVKYIFPEGDASISGIRYAAATLDTAAAARPSIDCFNYFPSQQLVVWRSSWAPPVVPNGGLAVWVKGGSLKATNHGHRDQGQVSVYWNGVPILIDCGTPDYADPRLDTMFANAAGHGIMQFGELAPRNIAVDSPIVVTRLDGDGGSVTVDTHAAYKGVQVCTRTVDWNKRGTVQIVDQVQFDHPIPPLTEVFRYHTGSQAPLIVTGSARNWVIEWPSVRMSLTSDADIEVRQQSWPDSVLPGHTHQALSVVSVGSTVILRLATSIELVQLTDGLPSSAGSP